MTRATAPFALQEWESAVSALPYYRRLDFNAPLPKLKELPRGRYLAGLGWREAPPVEQGLRPLLELTTLRSDGITPAYAADIATVITDGWVQNWDVVADARQTLEQGSHYIFEPAADQLGNRLYRTLPAHEARELMRRWVHATFAGRSQRVGVAYTGNGQAAGFVGLRRSMVGLWSIDLIGVQRQLQGRGWGKSLLMWALRETKGYLTVRTEADNAPALALYRSCGFQETVREQFYFGENA